MTDILRLFFIILLLTISLAAYFLTVRAIFTKLVAKTQIVIGQMPGRALGLGLVNFLFFGVIAVVLLSLADKTGPVLKAILTVPAMCILAFLAVLLSIGLTGMVHTLGGRIFPDMDPWQRGIWTAVVLCFACALPFVGWFLLFPYLGLVGIGAAILSFFQKNTA